MGAGVRPGKAHACKTDFQIGISIRIVLSYKGGSGEWDADVGGYVPGHGKLVVSEE